MRIKAKLRAVMMRAVMPMATRRCIAAPAPMRSMPAMAMCNRWMGTFYTKEHEWVRPEGDVAAVGISTHAAGQLGDIVYVELPDIGHALEKGEPFGVAESVKAASDVYSPVSGEVVEINEAVVEDPALINGAAETDGWMMKVKLADASSATAELMNEADYAKYCEEDDH